MNSDLPQYCQPGPSTSNTQHCLPPVNSDENVRYSAYHYEMDTAQPSTSGTQQLPYSVPLPAWPPDAQSYPAYMSMAVNAAPPPQYMYPSTSSLRLPATEQTPPTCLDWTINPKEAPPRQFKTTSEPLFTLGYSSTISENWIEGDKGLQYSIKNFIFSTKRTSNANEAHGASHVCDEYDSLLVSIPQVQYRIFCLFCTRHNDRCTANV